MRPTLPIAVALLAVLAGPGQALPPRHGFIADQAPIRATGFAGRIAALSEAPGYFDTDNLISNERSYLHVLPDLDRAGVRGGAYLGVGPDQNFSYIAHVRPAIALVVDIRRDNLLLHLLFKALFAQSRTRVEYLALLTGRAPPPALAGWPVRSIVDIVAYVDRARPMSAADMSRLRSRVEATVRGFGLPLSAADLTTIQRFHREFATAGLDLRFTSTGRAPQGYYPDYRELLIETDPAGRQGNFLAAEESFQFIKALQARDLVIPVVGNLAGPSALTAIARFLAAENARVSVFYTSNVEFYLFRDGSFPRFVENLARLPRQPQGVIVRSVFGAGRMNSGAGSASHTHRMDDLVSGFAAGRYRRYQDLIAGR